LTPLANYLRSKSEGAAKFPIVQTEASFFNAMIGSLKKSLGDKVTFQEIAKVNPTETDFRTIIAKLKREGSTQIGIFLWPEQLLSFLKQAREFRFSAEYFGTDLCESEAKLTSDEKLVEGCVYPDNDASEDFRARYFKEYGNESQLTFAASAYDMTVLIGELVANGNNLDAKLLLNKMQFVKDREGVLGKFSFEDSALYGQFFEYPVVVKRIYKGRGVAVKSQ
jgi:ABC-type branched-subunit amino acid transport system substrate-binding protein